MIWFLSVISICSSFLFFVFLNIMFTVLFVENVSPLFAAYASNLLVTSCSALTGTLRFLVEINIAILSVESDP